MVTLWDKAQLIKINAYKKKVGNFNIGIDKEIPEKKRLLGHKYKDISPRCSLGACARAKPAASARQPCIANHEIRLVVSEMLVRLYEICFAYAISFAHYFTAQKQRFIILRRIIMPAHLSKVCKWCLLT